MSRIPADGLPRLPRGKGRKSVLKKLVRVLKEVTHLHMLDIPSC